MKTIQKAIVVASVGLAAVSGMLLGATVMPRTVVTDLTPEQSIEIYNKGYAEGISQIVIPEPLIINHTVKGDEVIIEKVPVEFLQYIKDQDGDLAELDVSDLDDDELDEVVSRIAFVNEAKKLALDKVSEDLFSELDRETFNFSDNTSVKFDEEDLERLRLDDESDEVVVEEVDFDDKDAEIKVTGRFEQDDVKYTFEALVSIKDGEVEDIEDIEVTKA